MQSVSSNTSNVGSITRVDKVSLEEARSWIGRRLVLQKSLLGFEAGTLCIVMCTVDFGDGLLLWIVTDDKQYLDVDQFDLPAISEYFELLQTDYLDQTA